MVYDELKLKMKAASKLKPKTWDSPPYLMMGMRDGQSFYRPNINDIDPKEFERLPELKEIAYKAIKACTNNQLLFIKITKATSERFCFGILYDLSLGFAVNGRRRTIRKMVWSGELMHFTGKPELADQHEQNQSVLVDLDDKNTKNKFRRLALCAAVKMDPLNIYVEPVSVSENYVDGNGYFQFVSYTIIFKAQKDKPCNPGALISPEYAVPALKIRWSLAIDDSKADFYRFRASVATEPFNKISYPGRCIVVDKPKRPLSDIDLLSPEFEFPAMLFIAIYNFQKCEMLTFDRVVSATVEARCWKLYTLDIQAKDENGAYYCFKKTEMYKKSAGSLFEISSSPKVEVVSSVESAPKRAKRVVSSVESAQKRAKRVVSSVESAPK